MVLDATLRNTETVLTEGDELCESEHFVACNDISITNNGLTNANDSFHVKINQNIDFATGTYTKLPGFCANENVFYQKSIFE